MVGWVGSPRLSPDQPVQEADWEIYLRETANMIVEQQSPRRFDERATVVVCY